ncbi:MAG: LysM peptidoglycan-binding domain-containing protein [Actinomycetota bacterium]|nr:LysM peptidoglycan-binding domain-containing protein [Actinomycetota bacterium]
MTAPTGPTAAATPDRAPTAPSRRRRLTRTARALGVPLLLAAVVTASSPGWTTYRIQRGDTLSGIAQRYHTTVAKLVKANDLPGSGGIIYAGRTLKVPAPQRAATPVVRHRVRPGETVSGIAVRYRVRASAVIRRNRLSAVGFIRAGQVLTIPRARPVVRTSANTFAGRTYPDRIVNAASANRAILERRPAPSRDYVRRLIVRTAHRHGVDPALALAVSYQESGWNHARVSVANAIGAMQVIPSSGDWASSLVGRRLDLLDVEDNVTAGVVILRVLRRAASSERQAIAAYYQGLRSVRERGMYPDTRRYVANVQALARRFG